MLKQIKNTIDDNLKCMFNFSYENFLSKESEHESKELSGEIEMNVSNKNIWLNNNLKKKLYIMYIIILS